jgi:hypothetical protein
MKKFVLAGCIWISAIGVLSPASAGVIYNFSFSASSGTVTGLLSGTVDLPFLSLGGSGSGASDSLILTTIPAGFGALAGGNVVTSWVDQATNSFTVVAGTITSFTFFAGTAGADPADLLCLNSTTGSAGTIGSFVCPADINELHTNSGVFGFNSSGLSGVTFSPSTTATPEPGTVALLGSGLLLLWGASRRRMARG